MAKSTNKSPLEIIILDIFISMGNILLVFQVSYSHTALKALRRLPVNWRSRIIGKIEAVAREPHGTQPQVKLLAGRGDFRLRVGDWRVLFRLNDTTRTMTVLDILKRDEAYR